MRLLLAALCSLIVISGARDSYADAGGTSQLTIRKNFKRLIESKSCRSCDLSGVDLNRVDLSGADLEGANLAGAKLYLADLSNADLRNADLQGAGFGGADLAGADLRGANLTGAMFGGAYLTGALLDSDAFSLSSEKKNKEKKPHPLVTSNTLSRENKEKKHELVVRERRDFEHAPFRLSEYFSKRADKKAGLDNSEQPSQIVRKPEVVPSPDIGQASEPVKEFTGGKKLFVVADTVTDFSGKTRLMEEGGDAPEKSAEELEHLVQLLREENRCVACDFSGADLTGFDLQNADLERATLVNCNLQGVDLREANLKGVNFRKADLRGADLRNVDLYKADLSYADLTGADLNGALLDSTETLGAKGLVAGEASAE